MKVAATFGFIFTSFIVATSDGQEILRYTSHKDGDGWLAMPIEAPLSYHTKFLKEIKIIPTTIVYIDNKLNNKKLDPIENYAIEKFKMTENRPYMYEIYLRKVLPKESFYLGKK